jgi:hypothetical protein
VPGLCGNTTVQKFWQNRVRQSPMPSYMGSVLTSGVLQSGLQNILIPICWIYTNHLDFCSAAQVLSLTVYFEQHNLYILRCHDCWEKSRFEPFDLTVCILPRCHFHSLNAAIELQLWPTGILEVCVEFFVPYWWYERSRVYRDSNDPPMA